mmetsp:Transcript_11114/g.26743  ORF Transcript_11114/g.26743 Transcript_11114/m.26743 type:complete len:231 (-) Transcript_11114:265-957(-)
MVLRLDLGFCRLRSSLPSNRRTWEREASVAELGRKELAVHARHPDDDAQRSHGLRRVRERQAKRSCHRHLPRAAGVRRRPQRSDRVVARHNNLAVLERESQHAWAWRERAAVFELDDQVQVVDVALLDDRDAQLLGHSLALPGHFHLGPRSVVVGTADQQVQLAVGFEGERLALRREQVHLLPALREPEDTILERVGRTAMGSAVVGSVQHIHGVDATRRLVGAQHSGLG